MPVWYFAYGSNMNPATLSGRRGLSPLASRCAWVDGYRLCFDIAIGPGERGVANLTIEAGARTHGVVHLLSDEDAERLDRTEGVHVGLYFREDVAVVTDDRVVPGFAYRSARTSVGRKPSARYLDILLDGARHHGLPAEYVRTLEALELAFDERIGAVRR
jgi:cation transport regulator ChaC